VVSEEFWIPGQKNEGEVLPLLYRCKALWMSNRVAMAWIWLWYRVRIETI
jgi:hypothetical protein